MLPRFLSVTGVIGLGACAALQSGTHEINLPCAPCAFADVTCSLDTKPNAYLTVDFAIQNGTLHANNNPIFPPSTPMHMQFPAIRHWDSSTSREIQHVVLAYALDAKQFPSHASSASDVFRLSMSLLDLHGRPATTDWVTVGLVRNAEEKLLISNVQTQPARTHHHGKTWNVKFWKTQVGEYLVTVKEAVRNRLSISDSQASIPNADRLLLNSNRHPSSKSEQDLDSSSVSPTTPSEETNSPFQILSFYQYTHYPPHRSSNHRHFLRMVRPIILPALLGILSGFVACVIGFLLGRIIASVYLRTQKRKMGVSGEVEEGVWEKERLIGDLEDA